MVSCERSREARLLAELVAIPTVNDPATGRKPGLEEARQILQALRRHGAGESLQILEDAPAPVIIGVKRGPQPGPVTLLLAHYDVVPPGPGWTVTDPFQPVVREGRLYGRGAADDKSNVTALALAFQEATVERGTLIVAFTGDEETGGRSAAWLAGYLREQGLWPRYLINGDGSLSRIITRRRAAFSAEIRVPARRAREKGTPLAREFSARILLRKTMHSAYFIPGVDTHPLVAASLHLRDNELHAVSLEGEWVKGNVIPRSVTLNALQPGEGAPHEVDEGLTALLAAIVPLVRAPVPAEMYSDYGVTINPNVYRYSGGEHILQLDIRAMTRSRDKIKETLEYVLENSLGRHYTLDVRGRGGYLYTSESSQLVALARSTARALDLPDRTVEAGGASDSRHFSPHGVESIDYGPLGYNIHGPDEHVVLEHLCKATRFYRELVEALHARDTGQ